MVSVEFDEKFIRSLRRIRDYSLSVQIKKRIEKIIDQPRIGKPMMHARKGTREVYVGSFRLAYCYFPREERLKFLSFYHKDEQ